MKFTPIGSHVNKNEKSSLQFKNPRFRKTGKKVWRYGGQATFPQKLALIRLMVSEKMRFTNGRPRHGISSADTVKQS